ncbi:MAG: proline--tRNA ligase [Planctomycetota bacterium]
MTTTASQTSPTGDAGVLNTSARGDIHRWSQTLIPTTREAPADATTPSHVFMVRAGFIRQLAAGVYDYLPLAWRSLRKIQRIIREEHERIGAMEMLFPAFEPMDLLKETGRDEAYGDDLFTLTDRHGRGLALAPTHEEPIVEMMKGAVTSYKQLPLSLYQIQTKYRDEPRPRSGLLRCREFMMKDAYSFHLAQEGEGGLDAVYDDFYDAYSRIFGRCGLDFTAVEAESGPIGGSASHEFMVHAQSGEDKILVCPVSGYAANVEKAEIGEREWTFDGAASDELKKHHTPGMPGIDLVAGHLGTNAAGMLKTIVFERVLKDKGDEDKPKTKYVLAVVRGDHEVNEAKVRDAVGSGVKLADEKKAKADGLAIGYVSPCMIGKLTGATLVVDPDAAQANAWATGADEMDHHVTGWYWSRDLGVDLEKAKVADIRNANEGDPSPRAEGAKLETQRGIEVGHIFKLGTKYSDAMGFTVLAEDQKPRTVTMGCYGIGVSRTMAACVEMSHDDGGIIWPAAVAPYHVQIILMKHDDERQIETANSLAQELAARGADVLIDDRKERPGPKFKDADLIGIPVRLTLGDKALDAGGVEFKRRKDEGKGEVVPMADVIDRCITALESA